MNTIKRQLKDNYLGWKQELERNLEIENCKHPKFKEEEEYHPADGAVSGDAYTLKWNECTKCGATPEYILEKNKKEIKRLKDLVNIYQTKYIYGYGAKMKKIV